MTDWERWFKNQTKVNHDEEEDRYQMYKERLMQECSLVPRWTEEEAAAWRKKMVSE